MALKVGDKVRRIKSSDGGDAAGFFIGEVVTISYVDEDRSVFKCKKFPGNWSLKYIENAEIQMEFNFEGESNA